MTRQTRVDRLKAEAETARNKNERMAAVRAEYVEVERLYAEACARRAEAEREARKHKKEMARLNEEITRIALS